MEKPAIPAAPPQALPMRRRRSLPRLVGVGALILAGLQVLWWVLTGARTLDDQFYRDQVVAFASASARGVTEADRILACEARFNSLSISTLEMTASQLKDANLEQLTTRDLAPIGKIDPAECNCFSLCYDVVLNLPAVGIVEATFRPTITSSQRGQRYLYLFFGGRWVRIAEYGGWEQ